MRPPASALRRGARRLLGTIALTTLFGCGGDSSVHVCVGDAVFCATAFDPVARAGSDQTVAPGDAVTLDGSASSGGGGSNRSFAWVQTGGTPVTLTHAGSATATFVAPPVASATDLTFRLTVVNEAGNADSGSTVVTVEAAAAAAVASALALFAGPLQPSLGGAVALPNRCPTATAQLPQNVAAAQAGLFLAARSLAIVNGADSADPSAFFDAARAMTGVERDGVGGVAGRVETFGLMLLGSLAAERDPALGDAVAAQLASAVTIDDPAALLTGRAAVVESDGVRIESVADPAAEQARAVTMLLAARVGCPREADALRLSAAGLRVIAASSRSD